MSKLKNEYDTAEAWLRAAFDALRPDFEAIGKTLPATIRGNFGFTSHGGKKTGITGGAVGRRARRSGAHDDGA
jgi:hypothetical protein